MKIAICDDEREFLENVGLAIETYLNEKGLEYNIDLYNSGKVIMELRENIVSYDVVFLDINMPEVSGLEVAEWIRTYSDNVNIVFITAIISYAIQGYKYNAVRYILKNERQLKASIYECMDAVLYNMNYRIKNHPLRTVSGLTECLNNLKSLDDAGSLLSGSY